MLVVLGGRVLIDWLLATAARDEASPEQGQAEQALLRLMQSGAHLPAPSPLTHRGACKEGAALSGFARILATGISRVDACNCCHKRAHYNRHAAATGRAATAVLSGPGAVGKLLRR